MNKFKSLVLKAHGTNCEIETNHVLKRSGFESSILHINDILKDKSIIDEFSFIIIPGGFSYGDYTGSGRIVASIIRNQLIDEISKFIDNGKLILGICNGFQILIKSGILPNLDEDNKQDVSLIFNNSHQYEDRWIRLKTYPNSVFTHGINEIMELPIAHAEGKFVYRHEDRNKIKNIITMQYVDEHGEDDENYPINPNGSMDNIAAISDKSGRVMGMMPHPERFYRKELYYKENYNGITGDVLFDNAYKYIKEEL